MRSNKRKNLYRKLLVTFLKIIINNNIYIVLVGLFRIIWIDEIKKKTEKIYSLSKYVHKSVQ